MNNEGKMPKSLMPDALNRIGICIKDSEFRVTYQNEVCTALCGNQQANICNKGCAAHRAPDRKYLTSASMVEVEDQYIDCVIIEDGDNVTTFQFTELEKNKKIIEEFIAIGLTKAEMKVAIHKLQGWTNQEIAERLFIAKSTLKTHLNHIYHKAPEALRKKMAEA